MLGFIQVRFSSDQLRPWITNPSGFYKEKPCAIKMMFTPELTPETIDSVCAEAGMLGSLRHPNIVDVIGVCVYPPSVCMVMELCRKGSVFQMIHKQGCQLPKHILMKLCIETANAVAFLHEHEPTIIHLDIKPSNLLLDQNFTVKLADLELARRYLASTVQGFLWQCSAEYAALHQKLNQKTKYGPSIRKFCLLFPCL